MPTKGPGNPYSSAMHRDIQSANATNPLGSVWLWTKLARRFRYVKINTAIKRRELSAKDTLTEFVAREHLPRRFEKTGATNQILPMLNSKARRLS